MNNSEERNAPFETFVFEGEIYHQVGLIQMYARGYSVGHPLDDPPKYNPRLVGWLVEMGSDLRETMVGPPMFVFPNRVVAECFRNTWHDTSSIRTLPSRLVCFFTSDYELIRNNTKALFGKDMNFFEYVVDRIKHGSSLR